MGQDGVPVLHMCNSFWHEMIHGTLAVLANIEPLLDMRVGRAAAKGKLIEETTEAESVGLVSCLTLN